MHHLAFALSLLLLALGLTPVHGQRNLTEIPDTDPAAQLAAFQLDPSANLEITLWASEPMSPKPIQMNWDSRGRMWIASTKLYPQVAPGQEETDKVIVLEDTNGDGKADRHTVFADNLHQPTGVMPVEGGAYVANTTELLFLRDADDDLKVDEGGREVVFTGFGSEDTHHILHTFRRGPDGLIHFNQSIYIHSHIETPYGVRRLHGGGIWSFRPVDRRLEIIAKGLINPWGYDYDRWTQAFATDGAGGEGINHVFPGAVFRTAPNEPHIIPGLNPGQPKHCGFGIIEGGAFPEEWQGTLLTCDFRGHRINRFALRPDGSSYLSTKQPDLLATTHGSFRPIDIRQGPDGALYVADWYNPIIQHGEVDFRDERRDHVHGRIWRIAPKGAPARPIPDFAKATTEELLDLLGSPEGWPRREAKRELLRRDTAAVETALNPWLAADQSPQARLHALWLTRGMDRFDIDLLSQLAQHADPRVRAGALRAATRIAEPFPGTEPILTAAASDSDAQPRLMAIAALHEIGTPQAFAAALNALHHEVDRFIDFRLARFARLAADTWLPPYLAGQLELKPGQAIYALQNADDPRAVDGMLALLMPADQARPTLVENTARLGNPEQLGNLLGQILALPDAKEKARLLQTLAKAAETRPLRPAANTSDLLPLVKSEPAATRLAGIWKLEEARPLLEEAFSETGSRDATSALARLGGKASLEFFEGTTTTPEAPAARRTSAALALVQMNPQRGAGAAATLLTELPASTETYALFTSFLQRKGGAPILAQALAGKKLSEPVAIQGIQAIGRAGKQEPDLSRILHEAGGIRRMDKPLPPEELAALVNRVETQGDPARGEAVYRRAQLLCQACHGISEAGGTIGPDLVSIGASAPVDYLIESLLEPNKKIKEGYHTTMVTTRAGTMVAGAVTRDSERELELRDAAGKLHTIAKGEVASIQVSPVSLMPPGLTASLREDEFADLVAFLSRLGKEGDYKVGPEQRVRTWRAVPQLSAAQLDAVGHQGEGALANPESGLPWQPVYSLVSGDLPLAEVAPQRGRGLALKAVQFRLSASRAGTAKLALSPSENLRLWVGQTEIKEVAETTSLPLPGAGEHVVTILIKAVNKKFPNTFRATLVDPGESGARVLGGL